MRPPRILPAAFLVLAASAARAEGPVGPEEDLKSELEQAALRVSKALKDNEDALAKIARGESAELKTVDIDLPKKDSKGESKDSKDAKSDSSSSSSSSSSGGGGTGGALRGSEEHGKGVVEGIDELLKIAAKMSKSPGPGSGGGKSSQPTESDDPNDSGKPKNEKKGPEDKGDSLKDNKPDGNGKPESGEKSKSPADKKGQVPPSTPRRPTAQEMKGIFLAKLPDKVREAVENGDFDQVPEKYRDLIREWTKALSNADKAEAGGAGDAK
jgi:hypothetical protein